MILRCPREVLGLFSGCSRMLSGCSQNVVAISLDVLGFVSGCFRDVLVMLSDFFEFSRMSSAFLECYLDVLEYFGTSYG